MSDTFDNSRKPTNSTEAAVLGARQLHSLLFRLIPIVDDHTHEDHDVFVEAAAASVQAIELRCSLAGGPANSKVREESVGDLTVVISRLLPRIEELKPDPKERRSLVPMCRVLMDAIRLRAEIAAPATVADPNVSLPPAE